LPAEWPSHELALRDWDTVDRRLESRTPVEGLYLCGAATHPAGSVIALNGRNAAMAVLEDAGATEPSLTR